MESKIKQAMDSVRVIHNSKTKKWYTIVNFCGTNYYTEHTTNPWKNDQLMKLTKISIDNKIVINLHQEANKWIDLRDKEIAEQGVEKEKNIEVKIWDS